MLCINRLQFQSPIYSAGGRVTGKVTGKGTGKGTGKVTGKGAGKGTGKGTGKVTGKVTGKGAEIGAGKRCGWDVLQGIIYPSRRLQTQGCRAPFSDRH